MLQAIAADGILPLLKPFVRIWSGEPRPALFLSTMLASLVMFLGNLETMAPFISMSAHSETPCLIVCFSPRLVPIRNRFSLSFFLAPPPFSDICSSQVSAVGFCLHQCGVFCAVHPGLSSLPSPVEVLPLEQCRTWVPVLYGHDVPDPVVVGTGGVGTGLWSVQVLGIQRVRVYMNVCCGEVSACCFNEGMNPYW